MKLVLVDSAGRHDVDARIDGPDVTVADLARGLAVVDAAAPDEEASLSIDGLIAPGDLALAEAGLHDGATVGPVGGAPPEMGLPPSTTTPELVVVAGLDAGERYPLTAGSHLLGRGHDCDLVLQSATVSRRHCRVDVDQATGGVMVTNLSDRVGTLVDGRPVDGSMPVVLGSIVEIGAVAVAIEPPPPDDHPAGVDPFRDVGAGGRISLNRPPRFAPPPLDPPLEAPDAPSKANNPPFNVAMLLAPIAMGAVMAVALHNVLYTMFMFMSPVMVVGNWWETKHRSKRALRRDTRTFHTDLEKFRVGLAQRQRRDVERLRTELPHPAEVLRRAVLPSTRLWERRADHPDFLLLAAGYGDLPWTAPLTEHHRTQPLDPAVASVIASHDHIAAAPIATNLADGGVVGIVGNRAASLAVARSLVCQAAVHHGPADLHIAVLAHRDGTGVWEWTKWLPHTRDPRPGAGEQRFLANDETDASALLADLLNAHASKEAHNNGSLLASGRRPDGPTTLFVIDGDELLVGRNSPARQVLRQGAGPAAGVVLAPSVDRLPSVCTTIVTVDEWGIAHISEPRRGGHPVVELVSSGFNEHRARECAVALARYDDPELRIPGAALPELTPLPSLLALEQLDAAEIAQRWRASANGGVRAPIGVSEAGSFWLDLDRHGPHGLIGGTTGSGKSELLKTLVAAFAATYPPSELTFGLFDFKGGSTFTELADLPHTVGMASDLDVHLARRALRCLRAELLHRERLFDAAGVKDLPAYRDYRAAGRDGDPALPPIPRLIVIIDEFAAMAKELADELGALTDLTARGRSLGVHLLLATQKPSTAVNAEIRTNTRLRISLQVEDAQDSNDVIGIPDAAAVRQKGRGYFRVGQGEVVPIQTALASGHTSTATTPAIEVRKFVFGRYPNVAPPPSPNSAVASGPEHNDDGTAPSTVGASGSAENDLTQIVAAIREVHAASGAPSPRRPWPDPLPDQLSLSDLLATVPPNSDGTAPLVFALADDPEGQRRHPSGWPLRDGNLLLYGVVGSGTTTALTSIALSFAATRSADRGHLYALDFGAGGLDALARLPHCGGVVGATDRERQIRLIRLLRAELDRRRDLTPAGRQAEPQILVLVDNLESFRAAFDDPHSTVYFDQFLRVVADGPDVGIHFAGTVTRIGGVPHTIANAVPHKLLFRLADASDYTSFGFPRKELPTFVPGRAINVSDHEVVQVARPAPDLPQAVAAIVSTTPSPSRPPRPVRSLPTVVSAGDLRGEGTVAADLWRLPVGLRESDLSVGCLTLYEHEHALVAGPPRSGRSTTLLTLARSLRDISPDATMLGIATRRSPLRDDTALTKVATTVDEIGGLVDAALVTTGPTLVLVDDADTLPDGTRVEELVGGGRADLHVVVAGRSDVVRTLYGHWTQTVRRSKAGILIQPDLDFDGDLLGVNLPRRVPTAMGPGRGFLVSNGALELVQLAHE